MKFVKIFLAGFVTFFSVRGIAYLLEYNDERATIPTIILTIILTIIIIVISNKTTKGISTSEISNEVPPTIRSARDLLGLKMDDADTHLYAIAEQEINTDNVDDKLWSRALVKAKGVETMKKVEYMKLRVRQLKKNN